MKKEFLEAGKIVNTHGIKGEVKIQPWADSPEFLLLPEHLYIEKKPLAITSSKIHKGMLIAKFSGIDDINEAMRLKNKIVYVNRNEIELEDGHFFIQDIIGSVVVTDSGTELGKLVNVMETPGHNIYEVRGEQEYLIPAVPEFIKSVDAENMRIVVSLIEGM